MTARQASNAPPRDAAIGNLASLGIVLVVLGHSTPAPPGAEATTPGLILFREVLGMISCFHMPLFFFISGYLLVHTQSGQERRGGGYGRFVMGKAKRLLLPYWAISTVAFPFKAMMSGDAVRPVDFSVTGYVVSLLVPWQNTIIFFWFLPTLFLIFLFAPLLLSAVRSRSALPSVVVTLGLVALAVRITPVFWNDPLNYRGALSHSATFWLGMLWRERRPSLSLAGHAWMAGIAGGGFLVLWGVPFAGAVPWPRAGDAIARLLLAWTGLAACYGMVHCATAMGLNRVPWVDGVSYPIYLLSWFPQMLVKIVLYRWCEAGFWTAVVLMFVGGLCVPVIIARWVRRRCPRLKPLIGIAP